MLIRETVAVLLFAGLAHAQWNGDFLTLSQEAQDENVIVTKPSDSALNMKFNEEFAVGFNFGVLDYEGGTSLPKEHIRGPIPFRFRLGDVRLQKLDWRGAGGLPFPSRISGRQKSPAQGSSRQRSS